ncbi:MAG: ABC-2 transporter permease [[Eubacterium] sulci]|jgi:membrane protein|nr:ABC-2 transporter permease [[Eubacterium] sulci]MBF1170900.1 ABC-2 transporter permease [[Eubacterium] sulci]MBF1178682.1 ABC-2 transporter permease [[Eubacterium] sulci]
MKKLLALIIKDITFNRRNFIITFIVITALIFINASEYGDGGNNIVNYLFCCGAASIIAAPSSFGIEDDKSTRSFLSGLPVSQFLIIISKYILAIIASLIFSILGLLASFIANDPVPPICILIPISISIIVVSIHMFAFYKWDMNVAIFASCSVIVLPLLLPKKLDEIVIQNDEITPALVITIFIISLVVSTLLSTITMKVILKRR